MGVGGQLHAPAALLPAKRPGTRCTKGCVGPRANLQFMYYMKIIAVCSEIHKKTETRSVGRNQNQAIHILTTRLERVIFNIR
jgi:hypothetical protein